MSTIIKKSTEKAVRRTAHYVGRKATGLCISVGKAEIRTKSPITKKGLKTITKLVKTLDEVNPDSDAMTLGIGSNGLHGSIGKHITGKRILILVGSTASVWYGFKLASKFIEKKFIACTGQESAGGPSLPTMKPVNQSAEEIRNKAKDGQNGDYDAAQLIGPFLYKGDRAIVYSPYGVGKSVFCIQMAIDISEGRVSVIAPEDNGTHTSQTVIYYDGEMDDVDFWKIFGSMDLSKFTNLKFRRGGFFKNIESWLADVKDIIKNTSGDVTVFLDNITSVCSTINAEVIRELFLLHLKNIQDEAKKQGRTVTFIVVAHTTKQLILAGSNNLGNFTSAVLGLYKKDSTHIVLKIDKCRKYGDMQGKQFLLEKKQTSEGYKYDKNIREYKGDVVEPEQSAETPPPTKPVWEGKLSLEKTIEMRDFYQEGVKGHGWKPTAEKFGLSDHKAIEKEFKRLEKYLSDIEETED